MILLIAVGGVFLLGAVALETQDEKLADPCSNNPCLNGGTCTLKRKSFSCKCPSPYKGYTCEKDPCTDQPCKNGGTCKIDNNSFRCECPFPYTGKKCDKECKCEKGTCKLKDGNTVCVCPPEFSNITISLCK
ncbi:hypothetical protein NPIL_135731, partial [Nephila pilipes]